MTEAQLNARRENAKHSTGPRTEAGKKRSSLNAFRHGLTGQIVVQTPEDQKAFNKHCDGIRKDLDPVGALETNLAQAIAEDYWRLNRVRAMENGIFALGQTEHVAQDSEQPELDAALAPARTWLANAHELHLLALYESRISHSVEKNMARLRTLQGQRIYAPVGAQLEHFLTPRPKGGNHDPAGDLPHEIPESSVRSFDEPDPASDSPEPERFLEKSAAPLPEPATQPSRPDPPQQDPPQRVSPRPTAKQPEPTPWEPGPSEWVRNPIGQIVPRR
jgi:hypothetical protein